MFFTLETLAHSFKIPKKGGSSRGEVLKKIGREELVAGDRGGFCFHQGKKFVQVFKGNVRSLNPEVISHTIIHLCFLPFLILFFSLALLTSSSMTSI